MIGAKMSTVQQTKITACVADDKIELRGSFNERLNEFYRSLPRARWNNAKRCWTCDATPGAAWRILTCGFLADDYGFEPDASLLRVADCIIRSEKLRDERGRFLPQPTTTQTKLWRHQLEAFHFANRLHAALLAVCMGGGKSLAAIALLQEKMCRTVLILCPKSVLGVWRREFERHCSIPHAMLILDGSQTVKKKTEMAEQHLLLSQAANRLAVVVLNYEASWRSDFLNWATKKEWDAVIADESHRLKHRSSKQSKAAYEIGRRAKFRLALTGTPMPHSPLDLFGQFRFLDPGIFGTSYHRFRSLYAVSGDFGADHIVGFKNQEDLAAKMRLLTYEVAANDADLDLPEVQHHERTCSLGTEARRIYDEIEQEMISKVADGTITVSNALVKLLRLQQITSGHLKDDEETTHVIGTEKRDLLFEILDDIGPKEPVVVFCRFRHDLDMVREVADSLDRRYGEISGMHKDLTPNAEMPPDVDVLGVQVQSGGVGINLARSAYGVFFSLSFSLGDFDQCCARLHRVEQSRPVNFYHLVAKDTIDGKIYEALQKKRDVVDEILKYLRRDF